MKRATIYFTLAILLCLIPSPEGKGDVSDAIMAVAKEVAERLKGTYVVWCPHCDSQVTPIARQDTDNWHDCPRCKLTFRKNLLQWNQIRSQMKSG